MLNKFFVALECLMVVIGQIGRVNLSFLPFEFYLLEPIIAIHIAYMVFCMQGRFNNLNSLKNVNIQYKTFILFCLYLLVGFVIFGISASQTQNFRAFAYIVRVILLISYFLLLQNQEINFKIDSIFLLIPVFCLLQFVLLPDLRFMQQFGWDPHMYRAVGLFFDPPIASSTLLVINLYFIHVKKGFWMPTLVFLAVVLLFARSGYIVYLVTTIALLLVQRRQIAAIVFSICFVFSVLLAPMLIPQNLNLESSKIERTSTIISRQTEMSDGFKMFLKKPLFGIGWGRVAQIKGVNVKNHASSAYHSFWLTLLATTGILGFCIFVGFWLQVLKAKKFVLWLIFGSIAAIAVLENTFLHPLVFVAFTLTFASLNFEEQQT